MFRRFLRRRPWIVDAGGCLIVIVIIMDVGRRTDEFQKHRLKFASSKSSLPAKLTKQNET